MLTKDAIPDLDRKGLRDFGFTTGAIVAGLFGLVFPWLLDRDWPIWPWIVATPLWILAAFVPGWLRPIYKGWMRFGLLASRVTTPLVLGIAFYLVIFPISLIRRVAHHDAMHREMDHAAASYRVASKKPSADSLGRPF